MLRPIRLCLATLVCARAPPAAQPPASPSATAPPTAPPTAPSAAAAAEVLRQPPFAEFCETTVRGLICLNDGRDIVAPLAAPLGCVARYSFAAPLAIDTSGHARHVRGPFALHSGLRGFGAALRLQAHEAFVTPPLPLAHSFSLAFFVQLSATAAEPVPAAESARGAELPLAKSVPAAELPLAKSAPAAESARDAELPLAELPLLQLDVCQQRMLFRLSLDAQQALVFRALDAQDAVRREPVRARLQRNAWQRVFLVVHDQQLLLYVNGHFLDRFPLRDDLLCDEATLVLGNRHRSVAPRADGAALLFCDVLALDHAAPEHFIAADAGEFKQRAGFVNLGCAGCTLRQAREACLPFGELCAPQLVDDHALYQFFQLGVLRSRGDLHDPELAAPDALAVGLCCPSTKQMEK